MFVHIISATVPIAKKRALWPSTLQDIEDVPVLPILYERIGSKLASQCASGRTNSEIILVIIKAIYFDDEDIVVLDSGKRLEDIVQ